ncbi:hypothetical protein [Ramlibacter albus]|uniref:Uncharacterized protein n=1 Tax=Ramlibacter albus TaxID=2079448 RepID=A0A923MGH5_9BURK|nr:hypothetical protein [Ramlibacter albus]MBC5768542.1 hypothetical protein [Ramlibacter albus]
MNASLETLLRDAGVLAPSQWRQQARIGLALVERVRHLLEDEQVIALLGEAQGWLQGDANREDLQALAGRAAALARSHPGSKNIDGAAHAAVSATHALAAALKPDVMDAANYAAYAAVYAYAASAVTQPEAFTTEHATQVATAARLLA